MAAHQYSNNAQTALSGSVTGVATTINVSSATGFPTAGKFTIIVDSEIMLVTAVAGTVWTVQRAYDGSAAAAHNNNAVVAHILTRESLLNKDHIDIRRYGAIGDGTTDNTTALQAAIDAANTNNGSGSEQGGGNTIYIPEGIFAFGTTLNVRGWNVRFQGAGTESSVLKYTGASDGISVAMTDPTKAIVRFGMADLSLYGNSGSRYGLNCEGVIKQIEMDRVLFRDHGTWGAYMHNTSTGDKNTCRATWTNCQFFVTYAGGVLGNGGGLYLGNLAEQQWFYGCEWHGDGTANETTQTGVRIDKYTHNVTMYGGFMHGLGRGLMIQGGSAADQAVGAVVMDGVYVEDCVTGVYVDADDVTGGVNALEIRGNYFKAFTSEAIHLVRTKGVRIVGNEIRYGSGGTGPFIRMASSNVSGVAIGHNTKNADFSGNIVTITAGSPTYWYTEKQQQTKRVAFSALAAAGVATVTLTWDAAFPDGNYTVALATRPTNATDQCFTENITAKSATAIDVKVKNNAGTSRDGVVEAIAIAD